jgi:hypothetical protein
MLVRFSRSDRSVDQTIASMWGASTDSEYRQSILRLLRISTRHRSSGGRSCFEVRRSWFVEGKFDMSVRCDVLTECHVSAWRALFVDLICCSNKGRVMKSQL